jgi:hypothetical protein
MQPWTDLSAPEHIGIPRCPMNKLLRKSRNTKKHHIENRQKYLHDVEKRLYLQDFRAR